jgi:hypothetical protein
MTPERRKRITLIFCIISGMIVCAIFSLRHGPHRNAFRLGFDALMLINFWLCYRYNLNRRQPDTLIHLFPAPLENSKERS